MEGREERLKRARIEAGFRSGRAAAEALGISPATYAAHENGTRRFGPDEARRYARFFHVSPAWLLEVDDPKDPKRVKLTPFTQPKVNSSGHRELYVVSSGRGAVIPEYDLRRPLPRANNAQTEALLPFRQIDSWVLPKSYLIQGLKADPEQSVIVPVLDGDMAPTFLPGDKVIVDLSKRSPTTKAAAYLLDKPIRIARLEFVSETAASSLIRVSYDNPNVEGKEVPLTQLSLLGRVCVVIGRR